MRFDLTSPDNVDDHESSLRSHPNGDRDAERKVSDSNLRRWIGMPRTLRLTTRPRPPLNPDGSRSRTFTRISKSGSMPSFVFNLALTVDALAERLVQEALMPLFKKLHPAKSGWNLSLVNLCATNIALTASDSNNGLDRDIGRMFSRQEDVLKQWKIDDADVPPTICHRHNPHLLEGTDQNVHDILEDPTPVPTLLGSEDLHPLTQVSTTEDDPCVTDDELNDAGQTCSTCGAVMPPYAMNAHERFHSLTD